MSVPREDSKLLLSRRQFHALIASGAYTAAAGGCGTILYPERIGQPPGPLDWKVVALDALGLFVFFVPGVIAFVVDFYNGTIFLPAWQVPSHGVPMQLSSGTPVGNGKEISLSDIEAVVQEKLAIKLDLQPGTYVKRQINSLDEFPAESQKLALAVQRGEVRCQSPER